MINETKESLPLARFIYNPDWTPLKGVYIYPLKFFAADRSWDPNDYLEVIRVINVIGTDVAITRGGGLFVRNHGQFKTPESIDQLVLLFNLLLCEFAFEGLEPEPVTYTDVQDAKLIGRHVSITGGYGSYAHKTYGPFALLASGVRDMGKGYSTPSTLWAPNVFWLPHDATIVERIAGLPNALCLNQLSPTLPTLLVAAVSHSARRNVAETVVSSWIVCEQILSYLWSEHVARVPDIEQRKVGPRSSVIIVPDKERKTRLEDTRTYSASVRAEVLLTAGVLPADTYGLLQAARKIRNDLAHRTVVVQRSTITTNNAMRAMLRQLRVSVDRLPSYYFGEGGLGPTPQGLEPEFPFK